MPRDSAPPLEGLDNGIWKPRLRRFQELMRHRVQHILLVSSLYDSFTLSEDGHLNEVLLRQFTDLNISHNPDLTRVDMGSRAIEMLKRQGHFDLVISSIRIGDMNVAELSHAMKAANIRIPLMLLAYNNRELTDFIATNDTSDIHRIFLWQGDVRILLAMVKSIEDKLNVEHDAGDLGVPVVIVVEDNIRFYSSFLPVIYTELMNHTKNLISEGLNISQKMLRMRARPKVLLCESYEEAWDYVQRYEDQVLGVISDIEFPRAGKLDRSAGVELAAHIREVRADIPLVLQSSIPENEALAHSVGASFLLKGSPLLLHQLRRILVEQFGFGDFVFQLPDGTTVDRAHDLKELIAKLRTVPVESVAYHGGRNHFSNWLKARTEFALAEKLRPRKLEDFVDLEAVRSHLLSALSEYRHDRNRAVVADFDRRTFESDLRMARIGGGSLGGKARGLAFVNRLLRESKIEGYFSGVRIVVPGAVVLGTDIFDQFVEQNDLEDFAMQAASDAETRERFLRARFPAEALADLESFLRATCYPLAVRSSGLLEDSASQPFAGVYQTFMLPNNHPDLRRRLDQLVTAVKLVYASTFSEQAKSFLRMTTYRLEEEKMGVIIQRIVGSEHGGRFYPDFAGVARSYNFYPGEPATAEDGIVAVALGMGRTVVEGATCLRFCPKYPQHIVGFSSASDAIRNSQREFYALDLTTDPGKLRGQGSDLSLYSLTDAEEDGSLAAVGSSYSHENDVLYDGISRPGVRLVTFAPILKLDVFPLADLMRALLEFGVQGTSSPVEIEFAVNLSVPRGEKPEFGFLQMRPLALASELEVLEIGQVRDEVLICRSESVLGNGRVRDLRDLVVVDYHRFDRSRSREVANQVGRLNAQMQSEGRPYLLIGVGRWGSADPYLGIPVTWSQIAGARIIVEAGFKDFKVTPSQGTHFFQNLTSCNVGYFTINPEAGEGFIDWDWLASCPADKQTDFVRHIRLDDTIDIKMSGKTGKGVIFKPNGSDD
ncbi:MAG: PEP/pyruvate-binding domain-containing protein [Candidatus Eiseniibacteriota bacterium]|jgi:CheY-like chemotaxis protein